MAKERFFYLPVRIAEDAANPESALVYRPTLLTRVSIQGSVPVQVACVLDTGADCCILPASAAALLGLDLKSLPTSSITGIGNGANEAYYGVVTLELGRGITFQARVGFSEALERGGVGVLGQIGFFDQFNVEFRLAEGFFTIEPAARPAIQ
jgi:Aspartyl protease